MAVAGAGRCVSAAQGTGSAVLFLGDGGHTHGTAVACVAAPRAGAAVGGAGVGRRVWVARGTGSAVLFVGGEKTLKWDSGGVVAGPGGGRRVPVAQGTGSAVRFVGLGDVDMGRPWRAGRRSGEQGPNGSWWGLGERGRRE